MLRDYLKLQAEANDFIITSLRDALHDGISLFIEWRKPQQLIVQPSRKQR